jgi:hypothetical protein
MHVDQRQGNRIGHRKRSDGVEEVFLGRLIARLLPFSRLYASGARAYNSTALVGPGDFSFVCDESGTQTELVDWLGSAVADDVCGDVVIDYESVPGAVGCSGTIVWTAVDECGNANADEASLTIEGDTEPPTLILVGPVKMTLECGIDDYVEPGAVATDTCDATVAPRIGGDEVDDEAPGSYVITYDAVDLCGHEAPVKTRKAHVVDTLPPEVTIFSPVELWPSNHDYRTLTLADCVAAMDACDGRIDVDEFGTILSIYSDEPENATGDGNTMDDIVIVDDHSFRLRAERRGGGNGRVYGVTFILSDSVGNEVQETCRFVVPHDQSGDGAVDDGPGAGYTVQRVP